MHQVFLGTGKVLTKMIVAVLRKSDEQTIKTRLKMCSVPIDFHYRPKPLDDMQHWKAADFKLFFFHLGPLVFSKKLIPPNFIGNLTGFRQLSLAIRLLSGASVTNCDIESAEHLIKFFFDNFVRHFAIDSQYFNFHRMRHLWRFSSFPFESAHRELLTACSGTIKSARTLVEEFLKRQNRMNDFFERIRKLGFPVGPAVRKFTRVSQEYRNFLNDNTDLNFFGRYVSSEGKIFGSLAYTRLGENSGQCIFQTVNQKFVFLEVYVSIDHEMYALLRFFEQTEEILLNENAASYGLLYDIDNVGELHRVCVNDLKFKCVAFKLSKTGFEHN